MDGFRVRFEHGRGHRMVLEGEPAIRPEELDRMQLRMLMPYAVPGLLRFETEELDGAVAIRYSLSGRRMLAASLRAGRWTMREALTALCRLAEILEQGREYMLDLERYALEDEFIFVGEEGHDLALVYLPLRNRRIAASPAASFEKLIVRWMMNVDVPDGIVLQRLLQLAASPDFSPGSLLRIIRAYLADWAMDGEAARGRQKRGSAVAVAESAQRQAGPAPELGRAVRFPAAERIRGGGSGPAAAEPEASQRPQPQPQPRLAAAEPRRFSALPEGRPDRPEPIADVAGNKPEPDASRKPVVLLAITALVLALIWRFLYAPHPDQRSLLLAAGLSLLALAAACWLWKGAAVKGKRGLRLPGRSEAGEAKVASDEDEVQKEREWVREPEGEREERHSAAGEWPGFEPAEKLRAGDEADDRWPQEAVLEGSVFEGNLNEGLSAVRRPSRFGADAVRRDDDWSGSIRAAAWPQEEGADAEEQDRDAKTDWLSADRNETALLPPDHAVSVKEPYLEWEDGEGKRRIKLRGESLVIGRSKEAAQHVDETQGVSRAHLELVRADGVWQAKDLGSRNGSWLNGVPMAPYDQYPLQEGDSIQIASSLYRFNAG